jgi:hypothetical protein
MTSERQTQNEIRNALTDAGLFFRANVGRAWTGDQAHRISPQCLQLVNPRPFDTGLPAGFSDLFGATPITITPDMVGQTLAVFTAIEVKAPAGRVSMRQERFLDAVSRVGGFAGVARSVEDAMRITGRQK